MPPRHPPDAPRLGLPDQRQKRRDAGGHPAHIGGVAAEELRQARIVEAAPEPGGEARQRRHRAQERGIGRHPDGERGEAWPGAADHRRLEGGPEPPRLGREGAELPCRAAARQRGHRAGVGPLLAGQVEPRSVGPEMPRQHRLPLQPHMVVERQAHIGEEGVEHVAQGQHRWPGIHRSGGRGQGAHLAPGPRPGVEQVHRQPGMGQAHGRGEAAHAGTDHDRTLAGHGRDVDSGGPLCPD